MTPRTLVTVVRRVKLELSDRSLSRLADAALSGAGFRRLVEVGVTLVGDAEMRRLNRKWRRQDRTTDVLSFQETGAWPTGRGQRPFLGDIVISPAQVKRQARAAGVSWKGEFATVLVHGILHLLGYDHLRAKDEAKMLPLQKRILKKLKI